MQQNIFLIATELLSKTEHLNSTEKDVALKVIQETDLLRLFNENPLSFEYRLGKLMLKELGVEPVIHIGRQEQSNKIVYTQNFLNGEGKLEDLPRSRNEQFENFTAKLSMAIEKILDNE
jgi:hypothetical protein